MADEQTGRSRKMKRATRPVTTEAPAEKPAPKPSTVRVRMVVGPAGSAPRPWIINAAFFDLPEQELWVGPDPIEVSAELARALTSKANAERCRGRRFEIVQED